jgi:hypothetical protein
MAGSRKNLYPENNKYLLKLSPNILILVAFYIIRMVSQKRPVSKVAQENRNGYKVNKCAGSRWLKLPASRIANFTREIVLSQWEECPY